MFSVSLHSIGLSKVAKSAVEYYMQGISEPYITGATANPQRFVLQHGIDVRRLQCGNAFGLRMGLEEVDWRLGFP